MADIVANTDPSALLSGDYWNGIEVTGKPVIVTFSFPTSAPAYDATVAGFNANGNTASTFKAFTPAEQAQALQALSAWAAASGIIFVEATPGQGDINFQNVDLGTTSYSAEPGGIGFYPFGNHSSYSDPNYFGDLDASGDVFMNTQYQQADGSVEYGTLLHEIGHAIGLKHPTEDVYNRASGIDHDQELASDDPSLTIMAQSGDDGVLQSLDKAAAATIYGAAGTGGVYTASASGTNAVSAWSWNAATQTLTQTAVSDGETIIGTSVNDVIHSLNGDNRLIGLSGNNELYGGTGNDSLYGGTSGTNLLVGGAGDDSYYVFDTTTTIEEDANAGNDTVYATVSYKVPENVETLYLSGPGLTGTANDQNDTIFADGVNASTLIGGAGDDYMAGGTANDTIEAGTGTDQMFGGGGDNTFVFGSAADAAPNANEYALTSIGDFVSGKDRIDLSSIKTTGADPGQSLTFIGEGAFTHHAGEVHQVITPNDNTILEGDLNGDGVADFQIELYGVTQPLQGSDVEVTSPPCYCPGTLILTRAGDVPVEALAIGDLLVTAAGMQRRIKWIGMRGYAGRFANANRDVLPVCFKAGSLADGIPRRDLWVSPKHAMFLDGVLIPAEHLVNGVSVVKADRVERVDYVHIELDSHDVILAEGAPSETFVDDASRAMFHNAHAFAALYPETAPAEAVYCAPRVDTGFTLEAVRRRIDARAGLSRGASRFTGPLRGCLERVEGGRVSGWAQDERRPDAPVCLDVLVRGVVVARTLAERFRIDLAAAGIGDGTHAFDVLLPGSSSEVTLEDVAVRRSADGAPLMTLLHMETQAA